VQYTAFWLGRYDLGHRRRGHFPVIFFRFMIAG